MKSLLKRVVSKLPESFQQELKRIQFSRQIGKNGFVSDEPEYFQLHKWISEGDWVIDIGANVGHYSKRLSDLVGASGRVIAVEPMMKTFELLAANVARFKYANVTLLNVAASGRDGLVKMELPAFDTGLKNYYQARISGKDSGMSVVCLSLGRLFTQCRIRLIKIDVEGHEYEALTGLLEVLKESKPVLIVEGWDSAVSDLLEGLGYELLCFDKSPNRVFLPK